MLGPLSGLKVLCDKEDTGVLLLLLSSLCTEVGWGSLALGWGGAWEMGWLPRLPLSALMVLGPQPLPDGVPELRALGRLTRAPVLIHQARGFQPDASSLVVMENLTARPMGPEGVVAVGRVPWRGQMSPVTLEPELVGTFLCPGASWYHLAVAQAGSGR